MSWAPKVVKAYSTFLPEPVTIHTAIPPFELGGDLVDVVEWKLADGSVAYGTAGSSVGGGWGAVEFVMHATEADEKLVEMMARIGGSRRDYVHGGTLPMAGPPDDPPILPAVGFFYSGRSIQVGDGNVRLMQVIGLTTDELEIARRDSLDTVEAMWWKDGRSRLCDPSRTTSPSMIDMTPLYPESGLDGISWDGREVIGIAIQSDHDGAEGIRGQFTEEDGKLLAKLLVDRLPNPSQLACLLHAMMDFKFDELKPLCLRLLQVPPTDPMAQQWYADSLAMLAAIEEDDWDRYFQYESDFDLACSEAEKRRNAAGVDIAFGNYDSPFT